MLKIVTESCRVQVDFDVVGLIREASVVEFPVADFDRKEPG